MGHFAKIWLSFRANFESLKKLKRSKNGSKMAQQGLKKGIRKVQNYHKNDKITPNFV